METQTKYSLPSPEEATPEGGIPSVVSIGDRVAFVGEDGVTRSAEVVGVSGEGDAVVNLIVFLDGMNDHHYNKRAASMKLCAYEAGVSWSPADANAPKSWHYRLLEAQASIRRHAHYRYAAR